MYLRGKRLPELARLSEDEKREVLRRAWHEKRGYLYFPSILSFVFIFFMVERFHHLGVAWVVFLGGIIGAVGAILYMSVLLNTVVRTEVGEIVARTYNKSFKPQLGGCSDTGKAGAA